jgi:uncharacterized circularly permuted ATP-grasp superfamily protein
MSESLFYTFLSLGEVALVATALAIYLLVRYRRISRQLSNMQAMAAGENGVKEKKSVVSYLRYLQQNIERTKDKLTDSPLAQTRALQIRIAFLKAEANAQKEAKNSEDYWSRLIDELEKLLPKEIHPLKTRAEKNFPSRGKTNKKRSNRDKSDDINIKGNFDTIPTLKNNVK